MKISACETCNGYLNAYMYMTTQLSACLYLSWPHCFRRINLPSTEEPLCFYNYAISFIIYFTYLYFGLDREFLDSRGSVLLISSWQNNQYITTQNFNIWTELRWRLEIVTSYFEIETFKNWVKCKVEDEVLKKKVVWEHSKRNNQPTHPSVIGGEQKEGKEAEEGEQVIPGTTGFYLFLFLMKEL